MANTLTSTQVARVVAGTDGPSALQLPRVNAVHVKFTASGSSISTDTVVQMVAVPTGARVLDGMVWRTDTAVVDNTAFGVGDGSLTNRFVASGAFSITTGVMIQRFNAGVPYTYSTSVSLESRGFDTIDFNVGATSSCVTIDLHMSVWYSMELS